MRVKISALFFLITLSSTLGAVTALEDYIIEERLQQEDCLIPCDDIVNGGPGKDGIPSIDEPVFTSVADAVLDDTDKVIGIEINGIARAYPYEVLNWHEIVNDVFDGIHTSVTYCPLTGSGILYKVEQIGNAELGVSGKLYENNLIMYDRDTDTYYSQMMGVGIQGVDIENKLERGLTIETTFGAWKAMFPDSEILSRDTGHNRDYDRYPYGTYLVDQSIYFKSSYVSNQEDYNFYHPKALTVVLELAGITNLITFDELSLDPAFEINNTVIFHDGDAELAIAFERVVDGTELSFVASDSEDGFGLQAFEDEQTGSTWNILGEAIAGSLEGTQLIQVVTYNAFWFAATAFFGETAIIHIVGDEPFSITSSGTDETETTDTGRATFIFPVFLSGIFIALIIRKKR